jgi:hypothetical protein
VSVATEIAQTCTMIGGQGRISMMYEASLISWSSPALRSGRNAPTMNTSIGSNRTATTITPAASCRIAITGVRLVQGVVRRDQRDEPRHQAPAAEQQDGEGGAAPGAEHLDAARLDDV